MSYQQQIQLVNQLVKKTEAGQIDWKQSPDENAFLVSFKKNSVKLIRGPTSTANPLYTIEVIGGDGNVVESFDDFTLDIDQGGIPDGEFYSKMRELHELARRRAFGADKVLNEILKDLSE